MAWRDVGDLAAVPADLPLGQVGAAMAWRDVGDLAAMPADLPLGQVGAEIAWCDSVFLTRWVATHS
jgi:hypothetical protein